MSKAREDIEALRATMLILVYAALKKYSKLIDLRVPRMSRIHVEGPDEEANVSLGTRASQDAGPAHFPLCCDGPARELSRRPSRILPELIKLAASSGSGSSG
ncbi:hypothetical protein GCM10023264_11390 [Sphingomonas daechungensis]